ncbi:MAG: hypothetical protein ACREQZ_09420, partial [Woeseiaceae bacterium]
MPRSIDEAPLIRSDPPAQPEELPQLRVVRQIQHAFPEATDAMGEAPSRTPFDELDELLENLPFANIAFNAPTKINVEETAIIQLL